METLEQLALGLKRWHRSGYSWRAIGKKIGRSGGWVWFVAHGQLIPANEIVEAIMTKLPRNLWETTEELEHQVLEEVRMNHKGLKRAIPVPLLAQIMGDDERKVRAAYEVLRNKGYPFCTSTRPPYYGVFYAETDEEFWGFIYGHIRPKRVSLERTETNMIQGWARWKRGEPIEVQLQPELIPS